MSDKMTKAEMLAIFHEFNSTGSINTDRMHDMIVQALKYVPDDARESGYYCVMTDKGIETVVYLDSDGVVRLGKWTRIMTESELDGMTWLAMIEFSEDN